MNNGDKGIGQGTSATHARISCAMVLCWAAVMLSACSQTKGTEAPPTPMLGPDGIGVSIIGLASSAQVNIAYVPHDALVLPIPSSFKLLTAFRLDLSSTTEVPLTITLSGGARALPTEKILFLRQASLPNKDGVEGPLWMEEAEGNKDDERHKGTIQSEAVRFSGIRFNGVYAVVSADPSRIGMVHGTVNTFFPMPPDPMVAVIASGDHEPAVGQWLGREGRFDILVSPGPLHVRAVQVTPQGHVAEAMATATVLPGERRLDQPQLAIQLINISDLTDVPWSAPEIEKGSLENKGTDSILTLEGPRFVFANDRAPVEKRDGASVSDVIVKFRMPGRPMPFAVTPLAGSTKEKLLASIPAGVVLGLTSVSVTRPQWVRTPTGWDRRIETTSPEEPLTGQSHYHLIPMGKAELGVLNGSTHALVQRMTLGAGSSEPRAITSPVSEDVAYVALRQGGGVAIIDPKLLRQVDADPDTEGIDVLPFDQGQPYAVLWCCPERQRQRLFVSDARSGRVAIYDVTPQSETFHHRLAWMMADGAPDGLRDMAMNQTTNRLYVIAPGTRQTNGGSREAVIVVFDVDPDSPTYTREVARLAVDGVPLAIDIHPSLSEPIVVLIDKQDGLYVTTLTDDRNAVPRIGRSTKVLPRRSNRQIVAGSLKVIRSAQMSKWQATPYVMISVAHRPPASAPRRLPGNPNLQDAVGQIGIMDDPSGPTPRFRTLITRTKGSIPFLASDQYGEIRVLDRGTNTVTTLDLKEVFLALADKPSDLPLSNRHPKIIQGEFSAHGTPYDLASVGAIQVQMWIGSQKSGSD